MLLPLLHGVGQEEVAQFSLIVSALRNISTAEPLAQVVDEILRVVEPPAITISSPLSPAGQGGDSRSLGMPTDALPDDIRLLPFRPRLNIEQVGVEQLSPDEVYMT